MRVAFISDLHINSEYNNFKLSDIESRNYLLDIITNVDLLILNGDIFDLWRVKFPTKKYQKKELFSILEKYSHTFRLIINEQRIKIIIGNHDILLNEYINDERFKNTLFQKYEINLNNSNKILIYHGHLDIFNHYFYQIGQIITYIEFNIEKLFRLLKLQFIFEKFKKFYHYFGFKNKTQIMKMKKLIDNDDDIICVVNGHTHKPQILKFEYKNKKRIYINTGYSNGVTNNLVILNTDTLTIESNIQNKNDLSRIKDIIRPGDILLLSKYKPDLFSNIIRKTFKILYTNAIVYIGNNQVIDTLIDIEDVVQIKNLNEYLNLDYNITIIRLKDKNKIEKFINNIYQRIGIKFSIINNFIHTLQLILKKKLQ